MANNKLLLTLVTLGLFTAVTAVVPSSRSVAQGLSATTMELSAEPKKDDDKNVKKDKNVQKFKQQNIQQKQLYIQKKNVQKNQNLQQKKQLNVQKNQQNIQKKKQLNVQKNQQVIQKQKKFVGQPKKFVPKHNNVVFKFKMKGANQVFFNGNNYSIWRDRYRIRHHGRWRTFIALSLLAPLLIGTDPYYPYAYINVPGPYCQGLTADGCELVYDEIETLEGDLILQCVAYCPWQ